jgi:hypothetical protein
MFECMFRIQITASLNKEYEIYIKIMYLVLGKCHNNALYEIGNLILFQTLEVIRWKKYRFSIQ